MPLVVLPPTADSVGCPCKGSGPYHRFDNMYFHLFNTRLNELFSKQSNGSEHMYPGTSFLSQERVVFLQRVIAKERGSTRAPFSCCDHRRFLRLALCATPACKAVHNFSPCSRHLCHGTARSTSANVLCLSPPAVHSSVIYTLTFDLLRKPPANPFRDIYPVARVDRETSVYGSLLL